MQREIELLKEIDGNREEDNNYDSRSVIGINEILESKVLVTTLALSEG